MGEIAMRNAGQHGIKCSVVWYLFEETYEFSRQERGKLESIFTSKPIDENIYS